MTTPLSRLSNSLPGSEGFVFFLGRQQSKLLPKFVNLGQFKRCHPDSLPSLRDPDQGRKDQFQTTFLVKESRNDLGPALLLFKGPLQKVRRPDRLSMFHRTLQMIQTSLQILREGLHRRRIKRLILLQYLLSPLSCCLKGRSFKDRTKVSFHFWDGLRGKLGNDVTDLMNQTPLSQALGEHLLDGPNQPRGSIGGDRQGNPEPSPHHIPEQIPPALIGLLGNSLVLILSVGRRNIN